MFQHFDFEVIKNSLGYLFFQGMTTTIELTLLASLGGVVIGTVLAIARLSQIPILPGIVAAYVNVMRSLPLVLVIFWFYFLAPYIAAWLTGASRPVPVGGFISALIAFMMIEAAYFSEIVRAGIQSVPKGQSAAGLALGMSHARVMIEVVLPQAFRAMTPVLLTQMIVLFQDTSLVYVVSLTDFLGAASKIAKRDARVVELYLFVALVYFLMSYGASWGVKLFQKRLALVR